jgi:hypothetical protein
MKRANIQAFGMEYLNMLLIENMEDLYEYFETLATTRVKEAAQDILETAKTGSHNRTRIGAFAQTMQNHTGQGAIHVLCEVAGRVQATQIMKVAQGIKLAVNPSGGYFTIPENAKIEQIPMFKYTEKDINITKFDGGKHYYATIGGLEVVDEWGDKKWNTYAYAEQIAKKYLKNLNKQIK